MMENEIKILLQGLIGGFFLGGSLGVFHSKEMPGGTLEGTASCANSIEPVE